MTDPRVPSNPGGPDETRRRRLEIADLIASIRLLIEDVKTGNGLAVQSAERDAKNSVRQTKLVAGLWAAAVLFVATSGLLLWSAYHQAEHLGDLTAKLDESTRLLESLRAEQDKTQRKVEGVSTQVQAVADEQPKVELVDAGAGRAPKPAVVVRPKSPPRPAATGAPEPPSVVVPLDLPRARATDGGAP